MSEREYSTEEVLLLLSSLLRDYKPKVSDELNEACEQYPELREIVELICDLRVLTASLSKGDLEGCIPGHGYVVSNLKALQSNLNHLIWQLTQVSKGDFSQRIDFLGDFSESFNAMCKHLETQTSLLTELAQYDGLTKLANRYYLDRYLDGAFDRAKETGAELSLLMIDLDFFKAVNDTHGHYIGDIALVRAAEYFQQVFRTTDFIARYGGEEFSIVLPKTGSKEAIDIAERACQYFIDHPIAVSDEITIPLTVSIGVSTLREDDESWDRLIRRSDDALYSAKKAGRKSVKFLAESRDSV